MRRRRRRHEPRKTGAKAAIETRPKRLWYLAAASALLAALALIFTAAPLRYRRHGWPPQLTPGSARGFNVLLITLDTTRADRLGCYGDAAARTPALDALAADGVRFDDAVSVVPVTLPAHATILTGLNPPNHGVRNNGEFHLGPDHTTLAEVLRDEGYETAAFVSAFVLDARFGLDQGFDVYDDNVTPATSSTAGAFVKPIYERSAEIVTRAAIRRLERRDRKRPFFWWVHYFDPHYPYAPPPPFAHTFRGRPYDGEIAYMDAQIGRLLRALEVDGTRDHTLIVVVGDHGEGLGEHDETTHSKLIYESTMRVPLVLACRGAFQGPYVVDDVVVSIADIFPTVVGLLGVKAVEQRDGLSLLAATAGGDRMVYMETLAPYLDHGWSPLYGLRRHTDKYVLAPSPEYYDLDADPKELNNLHTRVSGAARASRDMLAAELASRLAASPSLEGVVASATRLDSESIRRLESLGYVGTPSGAEVNDLLPDPKEMMPVMRAIDRAKGLGNTGRHEEALAVIKAAAAHSPNSHNLLLTMGKTYLFLDRLEEAEEAFRAANALRPTARVCVQLAQIMLADHRPDQASQLLDQAETLDPRHGGIYLARGDLLTMRGRPDEAIAAYQRAEEVDPYRATAEARSRIAELREFMDTLSPP